MSISADRIANLRKAGIAPVAAGFLGAAIAIALASPAQALDTGWRKACTFPNAPQGYNEMMRERVCIMANDCQSRADALGAPYTGGGCFMVQPSTAAPDRTDGRPARR